MKSARLVAVAVLVALASGCTLTFAEHMVIVVRSSELSLAWDPPPDAMRVGPNRIESYTVSYRPHGVGTWRTAARVKATDTPGATLKHKDFGNGYYDFAVRAVTAGGHSSGMHTSLDGSADPVGGWYALWIR
jgi:hypothetical protein